MNSTNAEITAAITYLPFEIQVCFYLTVYSEPAVRHNWGAFYMRNHTAVVVDLLLYLVTRRYS